MRTKIRRWLLLSLAVLLLIGGGWIYWRFLRVVPIIVSRETTYFTEPLRADGTVDYAAALNKIYSKDVTIENNAAVLLVQALGPEFVDRKDNILAKLGLQTDQCSRNCFVSYADFVKRHANSTPNVAHNSTDTSADNYPDPNRNPCNWLDIAATRLWTDNEFPILAQWLSESNAPLSLVRAASQRPKFYIPFDLNPYYITVRQISSLRNTYKALTARAMLKLSRGDTQSAWEDIKACHTFGRLIAWGSFHYGQAGIRADYFACRADEALAASGMLTPRQSREILSELMSMKATPTISNGMLQCRCFSIHCLTVMSTHGIADVWHAHSVDPPGPPHAEPGIDWNPAMRTINRWYDRYESALNEPNWLQRSQQVAQTEMQYKAILTSLRSATSFIPKPVLDALRRISDSFDPQISAIRQDPAGAALSLMAISLTEAATVEERAHTRFEMTKVMFALVTHKLERGSYPQQLADVKDYLWPIPVDPFTGQPFVYCVTAKGFSLRSLGPDGVLDTPADPNEQESTGHGATTGDDIVIEVPIPQPVNK